MTKKSHADKLRVTTVRLKPAELAKYRAYAANYGLTFSGLVRGALAMHVDEDKK